MKSFLIAFLFCVASIHSNAQGVTAHPKNPVEYFNNFQFYSDKRTDSSLYFAEKLADSKSLFFLQELLHDSFAQSFMRASPPDKTDTAARAYWDRAHPISEALLLEMVNDTNALLAATVQPLYLWKQIRDSAADTAKVRALTKVFIQSQLSDTDMFPNRVVRYGLMIQSVLSKVPGMAVLSDSLLTLIYTYLANHQIAGHPDSLRRASLERRANAHFAFAAVNFLMAQRALAEEDTVKAIDYFRLASEFSPDLSDKDYQAAYFYDACMEFGTDKTTFQPDYADFLMAHGHDHQQVLTLLLHMALLNPAFRDRLKSYYTGECQAGGRGKSAGEMANVHTSGHKSFDAYWNDAVNSEGSKPTAFTLTDLNNNSQSPASNQGKWTVIDFWGTWCVPCRHELPDLEKLYTEVVCKNPDTWAMVTIACHDKDSTVRAFIHQTGYTFPVVMSDNKVEKLYNVQGYPTTLLITPQGKCIHIPFGDGWVETIKSYAGL